jgi:two-component system, chemotaxis family, CheB/CheR fusion protein
MGEAEDRDDARAYEAILTLVRQRRGVDFRDQRSDLVLRGIARRMTDLGLTRTGHYVERLARDDDEVTRLAQALVVPVSSFFRDAEVWQGLAAGVLPEQAAHAHGTLRVWAVGIATGEEVWTLAMLLAAEREARPGLRVELLASDVDERSLAHASAGQYPQAAAVQVPEALRERYLRQRDGKLVVGDDLRALVTFARHDLMGPTLAPPEAIIVSFGMIVARNVLLYFDERLRRKALERLHAVLRPGGALVLGSVESVPPALQTKFRPYPGIPEALHVFQRED